VRSFLGQFISSPVPPCFLNLASVVELFFSLKSLLSVVEKSSDRFWLRSHLLGVVNEELRLWRDDPKSFLNGNKASYQLLGFGYRGNFMYRPKRVLG
jgi:hypothetical protein